MKLRQPFRGLLPSIPPLRTSQPTFGKQTPRGGNRGCYCALLAAVVAVLLVVPAALLAKEETEDHLDQLGRILLIRGLDREIAVAKVMLPRGKHGVYINDQGKLDMDRAEKELRTNGAAIQPGIPVEITQIKFSGHDVVFEINNGGKNRKKWYQHIQIGMGGPGDMMQPVVQQQQQNPIAYGSSITLTFKGEKVPDLSVDDAKKLLSAALDFNRKLPTELYSPKVPEKFKEAIKRHEVVVGMNRDAVLSAKGAPFRKVRQTAANGEETEDWLYGLPPHTLFVTFNGNTVVNIHQY